MTDPDEAGFDWDDLDDEGARDVEESPPPEDDIVDAQRPRVVMSLPSGEGSLVLRGPGAGRTVIPSSLSTHGLPTMTVGTLPTRDQALSGQQALMIVHRPQEHIDDIPRLLASILAVTAGGVSLAASVLLPEAKAAAHAKWFDDCAAAAVRIADPACFLLDPSIVRVRPISSEEKQCAPYLTNESPSISEILDTQRAAGANLLLSSGRALDPSEGQRALNIVFAEATSALESLSEDERLALNLTLPAQWLTRPAARTLLLDQLLEHDQFDIWHIRVQLPAGLSPFQQAIDPNLLEGYRRLANLAEDEDRVLLLPQTGLTGWLQLGLGATGFGAASSETSQMFVEDKGRPRHGDISEVPHYFEPELLHAVDRSVHDILSANPAYYWCNCPYCPALRDGSWTDRAAKLHQLHWLGLLAADAMSGKSARSQIRRRLRRAQSAARYAPLFGPNVPEHLQAWEPLL